MLKLCSAPDAMIHQHRRESTAPAGTASPAATLRRPRALRPCRAPARGSRARRPRTGCPARRRRRTPCAIPSAARPSRRPSSSDRGRAAGRASRSPSRARDAAVRKRSPMSDMAAGAQVASPTPTPSRTTNSCQKLRARPDTAVSRLQTNTPPARMCLRAAAIREPAERHADERVEQREDRAEHAERRVAEPPLAPDPFADPAEDLAVEEVHQVDAKSTRARSTAPCDRAGGRDRAMPSS